MDRLLQLVQLSHYIKQVNPPKFYLQHLVWGSYLSSLQNGTKCKIWLNSPGSPLQMTLKPESGKRGQPFNDSTAYGHPNLSATTLKCNYIKHLFSLYCCMVQNHGTMKKDDENRLHVFEMSCLRRILGVTRLDKIRNTKIKESLNLDQDVLNRIVVKRLKYFGHINRMQNTRYPKN